MADGAAAAGEGRGAIWPVGKVFAWLAALTVAEVGVVYLHLPKVALGAVLLAGALAKALLVGLHFMHLRIERRLVIAMIVVSVVLAAVFVLGLVPDMVFGPGAGARQG